MKKISVTLLVLMTLVQGTFAAHITRAPGATIDPWNEVTRCSSILGDPDTCFIEGGNGSITLQAGTNSTLTYTWTINGSSQYNYTRTLDYSECQVSLPDGSKITLVTSNIGGIGAQYMYVCYKASTPAKASKPTGSATGCEGTSGNTYTTSGASGATSYIWSILPLAAGTITGTTTSASVNFTTGWIGTANITCKGHNAAGDGIVSDILDVIVGTKPANFDINGDPTPQLNSTEVYFVSQEIGTTYTWNGSAGTNVWSKNWTTIGWPKVTVIATNSCGTTTVVKNIAVKDTNQFVSKTVYQTDTANLNASIRTLTTAKATITNKYNVVVADTTIKYPLLRTAEANVITLTNKNNVIVADTTIKYPLLRTAEANVITLTNKNNVIVADTTIKYPLLRTAQANVITLTNKNNVIVTDTTTNYPKWRTAEANVTTLTASIATKDGIITAKTQQINDTIPVTADLRNKLKIANDLLADNTLAQQVVTLKADTLAKGQSIIILSNANKGFISDIQDLESKLKASQDSLAKGQYTHIDTIYSVEMLPFEETGIAQNLTVNLKAYPNPTQDKVKIESSEIVKKIEVYDLDGKLVFNKNVNASIYDLEVKAYQNGTYVINLYFTETGRIPIKIIKK
jgi:hypothetical protein